MDLLKKRLKQLVINLNRAHKLVKQLQGTTTTTTTTTEEIISILQEVDRTNQAMGVFCSNIENITTTMARKTATTAATITTTAAAVVTSSAAASLKPIKEKSEDSADDFPPPKKKVKTNSENTGKKTPKESSELFTCPVCTKKFSTKCNVTKHMKLKHPGYIKNDSGNCLCLDCGDKFNFIHCLREHLSVKHGLCFDFTEQTHSSENEFNLWKSEYEEKNLCSFAKSNGSQRNKLGQDVSYYVCNRSGFYRTKVTGERQRKSKGSVKINKNCTCQIKLTKVTEGEWKSETCGTHYGHQTELDEVGETGRTKTTMVQIATKFQMGGTKKADVSS